MDGVQTFLKDCYYISCTENMNSIILNGPDPQFYLWILNDIKFVDLLHLMKGTDHSKLDQMFKTKNVNNQSSEKLCQ